MHIRKRHIFILPLIYEKIQSNVGQSTPKRAARTSHGHVLMRKPGGQQRTRGHQDKKLNLTFPL